MVVWRRGYTVLSTGQILLSRDLRLSVHQGNLHISRLTHNDTGEYVCQVTSLAGQVLEEVHSLRVVVAASVLCEEVRLEAVLEESVTLRCAGRGVPPPRSVEIFSPLFTKIFSVPQPPLVQVSRPPHWGGWLRGELPGVVPTEPGQWGRLHLLGQQWGGTTSSRHHPPHCPL